ncbi:MAG: efflux RND transporter periplasmic adaptor subunit [Pseudomonadota bacterium]
MSMDRKIEKSRKPFYIKLGVAAVIGLGVIIAGYGFIQDASVPTFRTEKAKLTIGTVSSGIFEDFIPVRGTVTPLKSVLMDAVEGGRVEKIFVENGATVKAGDPIVELSNSTLQLSVLTNEANVAEQVNGLRNTRLAMEQNRLSLKSEVVNMDYDITRLERLVERRKVLAEQKMIPQADYIDAQDELAYKRNRREITLESQRQDEQMRLAQVEAMEESVGRLQRNLEVARKNLDDLIVKAPFDGQVSSLDVEMGQSLMRGESLGQVDDTQRFKLTVLIDEFYITRTREGQSGEFTLGDKAYKLQISRVYPQVTDGQFEVDMQFAGTVPPDIRRGQTLQTRVQLGDASEALLLPRGGFFQDTGGNWAFVLDASGDFALKRNLKLGRRNAEYFEVLEGLSAGEQVITSEYAAYADMERIQFN